MTAVINQPARDPETYHHINTASLETERALIGACLTYRNAPFVAMALIAEEHFLDPAHQQIWAALVALTGEGRPVTPLTMGNALGHAKISEDQTVSQYLARCMADTHCPASGVADFAKQIRELWALRSVASACDEAWGSALAPGVRPKHLISELIQYLDGTRAVLEGRSRSGRSVGDGVIDLADRINRMRVGEIIETSLPTGLTDLDRKLRGGFKPGELAVIAGRPGMGKSLLATSISRQMAKAGHAGGFFSLEMLEPQTCARMLSDALYTRTSIITGAQIINNQLSDYEAERVLEHEFEFRSLPLFIDDSSTLTVGEIGARTRSFADRSERNGKKLEYIVIDYLKFVRASERYRGQRHYEVGEITAGLKALAKEIGIVVILLAQLNREVEKRNDKRPELSDLRECVAGSTRLIDADTGHWLPITEFKRGNHVLALDPETHKIRPFFVEAVWKTGRRQVFRMTTRTGRQIIATDNHPFLGATGWVKFGDLKVGDEIATAMRLPYPGSGSVESDDRCRLLGYFVGDGTYQKHRGVGFISSDKATFADVVTIVSSNFHGVVPRKKKSRGNWEEAYFSCTNENGHGKPYGNPLREWLRQLGIFGQRDSSKRVPTCCFESDSAAGNFLAGYLSADGCVKRSSKGPRETVWEIHFDSVSRALLDDVQALLLRLGIIAAINDGYKSKKGTVPIYRLNVSPVASNLLRFAHAVPVRGKKATLIAELICSLPTTTSGACVFDLPKSVSKRLAELAPRKTLGARKGTKTYLGWKYIGRHLRREVCERWARKIGSDELLRWADSDLLWEGITSIEPAGEEDVYDISVPGAGNFIANGIVAHNSGDIEADADVVMLLYREAYYLASNPKLGTDPALQARMEEIGNRLEIGVAKNRMGETGPVPVFCHPGASAVRDLSRYGGAA